MAHLRLHGDLQLVLAPPHQLRESPGRCLPMGASTPGGCDCGHQRGVVNFALPSASARQVSLLLLDPASGRWVAELLLEGEKHRTGHVWHIEVEGLAWPLRYAWLVDGQELADPWSCALKRHQDGGRVAFHALFPLPDPQWRNERPARRPLQDLVIYELHVKGYTAHASSGVDHPGTYAGLVERLPYLSELGITAVELMPVHAFDPHASVFINPRTGKGLNNYWGYDPVGLLAPAAHYAVGGDPLQAVAEFRAMVDACHGAGLEVILDVVLNHTGEGSRRGPVLNFRGMDDAVWYMQDAQGSYLDFTGCGNTFNCNHPVVRDYILTCLRSWVTDFGVDGFRFDLAAVMGRDPDGHVLVSAPVLEQITLDPVLAGTRLIAEAWDAAGLYQVGSFDEGLRGARTARPGGGWAQWNGRYRDDLRRLLRGDPGLSGAAASRICGSSDLFQWNGRGPAHSLNFITCHDGFTLADLVSFNGKHNEENGEENRDGLNDNLSWNCGAEGSTTDTAVLELRARQQRNALALLFLSQGTPMLLMGDEMGRSQGGNNNAWCQDNETSWLDWTLLESHASLHAFVKGLIALRAAHASLRRDRFLTDEDIQWHGEVPHEPDFGPHARSLAWRLKGLDGAPDLFVALNTSSDDRLFQLPQAKAPCLWHRVLDTFQNRPPCLKPGPAECAGAMLQVEAHSVVVLMEAVV